MDGLGLGIEDRVGRIDGRDEGDDDGLLVGDVDTVGFIDGDLVGGIVGGFVGVFVGRFVGGSVNKAAVGVVVFSCATAVLIAAKARRKARLVFIFEIVQ